MYVALANEDGTFAAVCSGDPNAAQRESWTEWRIALAPLAAQGADLTDVNKVSLGFGDKNNPGSGGAGKL
ncbi:MAG: hypothetical protein AMJ65_00590 [Phycisphaerae bacterium SG8_4]|nr:MAG: hypothetical protein AMJ65_00590 [Phycisphaerae bacterium SG8_4]